MHAVALNLQRGSFMLVALGLGCPTRKYLHELEHFVASLCATVYLSQSRPHSPALPNNHLRHRAFFLWSMSLTMQSTPVDSESFLKLALDYFQIDDDNRLHRAARALEHRNAVQFSDLELDTSIFPYYADGTFNPPLPTVQDILAAQKIARARRDPNRLYGVAPNRDVVRVGPYFVKYGTTPEIFQVRHLPLWNSSLLIDVL
jgi:hypothetical protein